MYKLRIICGNDTIFEGESKDLDYLFFKIQEARDEFAGFETVYLTYNV